MNRFQFGFVYLICVLIPLESAVSQDGEKDVDRAVAQGEYEKALELLHEYHNFAADKNYLKQNAALTNYYKALQRYDSFRPQSVSEYWIGVQCVPTNDVPILSDVPHIGRLFHRGGLLVNSVTKDSPAEKAGLRKEDVIVLFNTERMDAVDQLVSAIEKSGNEESSLKILRDGRFVDLSVTPETRPSPKKAETGAYPIDRSFYNYAQLLYGQNASLPDDVKMTMTKSGSEEAAAVFKRGDQTWKIDSGNIDSLPEDIRHYASRIFSTVNVNSFRPYYRYVPNPGRYLPLEYSSASRLDQLSAKIDELQNAIENLRKNDQR